MRQIFLLKNNLIPVDRRYRMAIARKRIKVSVTGAHLTIRFASRIVLDSGEVNRTVEEIKSAIQESKVKAIVLDFSGVQQVSSQMLGQLLNLRTLCRERKGELRICGMR